MVKYKWDEKCECNIDAQILYSSEHINYTKYDKDYSIYRSNEVI